MNKKILYIHGFASSENSWKALETEKFMKNYAIEVIHPTIPVVPKKAIDYLENLHKKLNFSLIIGSSLGGFYALILFKKTNLKTILINPSLKPSETLKNFIGPVKRHASEDFFIWKQDYVKQLEELENYLYSTTLEMKKLYFFISKNDEILDSDLPLKIFPKANFYLFQDGHHAFEQYPEVLPEIYKILKSGE